MPRHKQITTCRRGGGPVSKMCGCEHCSLGVCEVCGGAEGTLTTDCPGEKVTYDRHQEVFETNLDYTDERGWHLVKADDGTPIARRSPRFEDTPLVPPPNDWERVERTTILQHDLTQKAIAWVHADRICEERSATLARTQDETAPLRFAGKIKLNQSERELLARLEREEIAFRKADRHAQKCDDEFRQAARRLVSTLEEGPSATKADAKP